MNAKIGRDTPLNGDLRVRSRDNHQVVYFETDDAGALFRFTDMYPRMFGGQMWVAMDPPSLERTPQVGTLYIRNFVVRGEPGLDRVVSGAPGQGNNGVQFSEAHCEFTKVPGRMAVSDGVVRGPVVGATVEGQIDYVKDDMHLRGTFVPFYGLNNMFGQIPIVGLFLGAGSNEGLLGITYEAVGPPGAPRIYGQSGDGDRARAAAQISSRRPTIWTAISFRRRADLARLQQHVALLAERKLDHAVWRQVLGGQQHFLVAHRYVVDLESAGLDLAARFAVGATRPAFSAKAVRTPKPLSSSARGISIVGSVSASEPSSKVLRAVPAASSAAARPCTKAVASVASTFLASLTSWPLSAASLADLVERQDR